MWDCVQCSFMSLVRPRQEEVWASRREGVSGSECTSRGLGCGGVDIGREGDLGDRGGWVLSQRSWEIDGSD